MAKRVKGKVFLVGIGPGNESLITQAAFECIKMADVILYDHLMSSGILENASSKKDLIKNG